MPKYVFGRPLDQYVTAPRIPLKVRQRLMQTTLRAAVGDMERYGLPKPDHRVLEAHPTVSDTILTRLTHGDITPKPNIARLTERTVVFADGSEEGIDVVIYGTGYKVSFPFFDPALRLRARQRPAAVPARLPSRSARPLLHRAAAAAGRDDAARRGAVGVDLRPPDRALRAAATRPSCVADIARERAAMRRRYVTSKRHTMQVDYDDYLFELRRERRARRGAGVSRREATKEANRAAILAAARSVFAEHGYEGAGVRDVVRRTDLAPGTFYNYFDGKDAVFRAVLEEVGAGARRLVRDARLAATTPEGFVVEGFRAFFAFIAADPATFAFLERNAEAVLPAALEELREDLEGRLADGVDSDYTAHAMVAVGLQIGALMLAREPVAVDEATAFAAGLFARVLR